jgi:anaerobic magnesium-protoporphyrin IX monomethyl ester cyclase
LKFSFINPRLNDDVRSVKGDASWPPLGLLYLATVLQDDGVEVSILDQQAKGYSDERAVDWVEGEASEILGFSTLQSSGRRAVKLSREVKERNPDTIIVFGNHHATFNARKILKKYPSVDIIVRGEGERTITELVECLRQGEELRDVLGITFRRGSEIAATPDRPLIQDLDSLPFPDRDLLGHSYHSEVSGLVIAPKKFTSLISSRGCVHECRFCCSQKMACNQWRPRSVANTLEELIYLSDKGYRQFTFVDDSFTLDQKRVIELCRGIKEKGLDIEWGCEGRVDNYSVEMFQEMAGAGCRLMYFGIESANQRILDYYKKRITPQQSEIAVAAARKAGMDIIVGSFIVGAPDETRGEISRTLEFAKHLQIDLPQFNFLGLSSGMDIWEELVESRALDESLYWETGCKACEVSQTAVSPDEIEGMIQGAINGFLLRPSFLIKQAIRTVRSRYRREILLKNLSRIGSLRAREIVHSKNYLGERSGSTNPPPSKMLVEPN